MLNKDVQSLRTAAEEAMMAESDCEEIRAFKAYRAARNRYDEDDGSDGDRSNRLFAEMYNTLARFLATRTSVPWVMFEKFAAFEREILHPDHSTFGDGRELSWFAGIKADALAVANALQLAEREA